LDSLSGNDFFKKVKSNTKFLFEEYFLCRVWIHYLVMIFLNVITRHANMLSELLRHSHYPNIIREHFHTRLHKQKIDNDKD